VSFKNDIMKKAILYLLVICLFSCTGRVKEKNKDKIQNFSNKDTTHITKTTINNSDPEIIYFKQSECNSNCEFKGKLLNQYYRHDTLYLKIASIHTCSTKFSGVIDYFKKGILNINLKLISGSDLNCDCVYYFDIAVKNMKTKAKQILINNGKTNYNPVPTIYHTPEYPKRGDYEILRFIRKNLVYPDSSFKNNIEGNVEIECVIDTKGKITECKVLKGINKELDSEALRIVSIMPKWIPALNEKEEPECSKECIVIKFKVKKNGKQCGFSTYKID